MFCSFFAFGPKKTSDAIKIRFDCEAGLDIGVAEGESVV
jgi:hypothetical protein